MFDCPITSEVAYMLRYTGAEHIDVDKINTDYYIKFRTTTYTNLISSAIVDYVVEVLENNGFIYYPEDDVSTQIAMEEDGEETREYEMHFAF